MSFSSRIPPEQITGYLVGALGTMLPISVYSSAGTHGLLGKSAELKLFVLCGAGAALGLSLGRGPGKRVVSLLVGGFAATVGVWVLLSFGARIHAAFPWLYPLSWPIISFSIGAFPMLALLAPLDRLVNRLETHKTTSR